MVIVSRCKYLDVQIHGTAVGNSIEKLYNGKNFIRDVRGKDGSIKKGTDFNEREFILSQLLFDYYG